MTELVIHLSQTPYSGPFELRSWYRLAKLPSPNPSCDLDSLKEFLSHWTQKNLQLSCVLPARLATSFHVEKPSGSQRHLASAIPYLVEDQLCTDIQEFHIAWQTCGRDHLSVVAIPHADLLAAIEFTGELTGRSPTAMYLDSQFLEPPPETMAILLDDPRALFGFEETRFETSSSHVATLARQASKSSGINRVCLYTFLTDIGEAPGHDISADQQASLQRQGMAIHTLEAQTSFPEYLQSQMHASNKRPTNLLQGTYDGLSKQHKSSGLPLLLMAISLLFFFHAATNYAFSWHLQNEAINLRDKKIELYREYFPNTNVVVDPVRQLRINLAKPIIEPDRGHDVTAALGSLICSLYSESYTVDQQLESIRYTADGSRFELVLTTSGPKDTEAVRDRLTSAGFYTRIVSSTLRGQLTRSVLHIELAQSEK